MRRHYRPAPPPLEANEQLVTALITAGWAVALITLLLLRTQLPAGERWWIWMCATGFAMGLFGLWYVPRLKRQRARTEQRRAEARSEGMPAQRLTPRGQARIQPRPEVQPRRGPG